MMKLLLKTICFVLLLSLLPIVNSFGQSKDVVYTTILKEQFKDKSGNILTGKGVLIGDIDSGIDIFSPMFFFADGGEYDWIDTDGNGIFTPGVDEINIDGKKVILRYIEMRDETGGGYLPKGFLNADVNNFNPDLDFLYLDINNNGKRDYGEKDGFSEQDPTYGEQFFIAIDANKNNILNAGEKIIALKTSKVRAIREKNGDVRRRGVDLIKADIEGVDHGTGVAGIILGGHYGVQKIHGFAPDAEIVVAKVNYDYIPRFVRNFPELIKFVRDEKINIMLYEDGEWSYEFLDGSSEEEQLADEVAKSGITVIGAAGNLATGKMHIQDNLAAGKTVSYKFECPEKVTNKKNDGAFVNILWKDKSNKLSFSIKTPDNKVSPLLTDGSGFIKVGGYNVSYGKDVSSKGTVIFKIGVSEKDSGSVKGTWEVLVTPQKETIIDGFLVDISQSWGYISYWISDKLTSASTITFPSTGDSVITLGAYCVNVSWGEAIGDLCTYSGVGPTIGGKLGVDVCAPGHATFTTGMDNSYAQFSGTSSAAPHAVGVAALLLQYNPELTHSQIKSIFINSAITDNFTGAIPNVKWGFGKLNPEGAIKYVIENF
ncbi:MAG TPA: S8 family serine peptidase [Ignavibacteria bacterium]